MTNKSIRDYINLIESVQQEGVAEGFGLRGTGNPGMPTPYDQGRADAKKGRPYDNPYDQPGEEQEHRNYRKGYEQGKQQGVAEGSLNEFAPDGFNGGGDGEEFNPRMAKMAYDEGVVKGASLADGATLQRAMAINAWDKHDGGIYKQHFAKGFKAGRMDKIRHNNKQYNLNLKLMKDGSIRHGEQGVAESTDTMKYVVYRQETTLYQSGERDHNAQAVKSFPTEDKAEHYAKKANDTNPDVDVYYFVRAKKPGVAEGSGESYIIVRTDAEGKKDVFAGNFDTYEQAQKELDACLAHPLHTKYKQKFEIKRKGGEQGVAEGSTDLVQIEYWQQETMESGRWVKTKPIPRATAEKIVNSFERGEIVDVEQGVAEEQVEESTPEAIAKINQITRK